ncbi:MAG: enoyl-CoA hydratase-related protein [Dehalococcoidia bacterium]
MRYDYILYDVEEGVATLTLNRPDKLNSLLEEMQPELLDALRRARDDDDVRALVLTGAGRAFCAGADVARLNRQMEGGSAHELKKPTEPVGGFLLPLYEFPKPTIASLNGPAVGAGVSLALACEMRVGSDQARLMPAWVARGLAPDGGTTWLLPRLVGVAKAVELLYTAKALEAEEALRLGIYNRVVPHQQLPDATRELAQAIAQGPPVAIEFTKRAVYRGLNSSLADALDYETHAQYACFSTADFKEAITAFREKRDPHFAGR